MSTVWGVGFFPPTSWLVVGNHMQKPSLGTWEPHAGVIGFIDRSNIWVCMLRAGATYAFERLERCSARKSGDEGGKRNGFYHAAPGGYRCIHLLILPNFWNNPYTTWQHLSRSEYKSKLFACTFPTLISI